MERADFESIATLGRALWPDPNEALRTCRDTVAAVSLLNLSEERATERIGKALLEQADAVRPPDALLNHPFFRLLGHERFALTALHAARWSYARVARLLSVSETGLQELAWRTRQLLAAQHPRFQIRSQSSGQPSGEVALEGPSCPDWDPERPWTQRFLDDEMQTRERLFVQNHLMVCRMCHRQLVRTRDVYYWVDELIPRESDGFLESELSKTWTLNLSFIRPSERTFLQSLKIFTSRADVRAAFVARS